MKLLFQKSNKESQVANQRAIWSKHFTIQFINVKKSFIEIISKQNITQNMLISEMLRDVLIGHNFTQNIQILYC